MREYSREYSKSPDELQGYYSKKKYNESLEEVWLLEFGIVRLLLIQNEMKPLTATLFPPYFWLFCNFIQFSNEKESANEV